jgi:1,4-alpha-glucan branching enzyme
MNNRAFIAITLLLLLVNCAQKRLGVEAAAGGVRFSFLAPLAKSVAIAGSFNRWDPGQDRLTGPDRSGIWTILLPLSQGQYEYRFVINNSEWVLDPSAPSVDDGLGEKNSVVIVPP